MQEVGEGTNAMVWGMGPNIMTVKLLRGLWKILIHCVVNVVHIKLQMRNVSPFCERDQHFMVDKCFQTEVDSEGATSNALKAVQPETSAIALRKGRWFFQLFSCTNSSS